MAIILNIDTSVDTASLCLAKDGKILQAAVNDNQKDHASWLHPAIQTIMKNTGTSMNELQAVAVTIGPGSYTGLRVCLSSAKGLCFALNIPLIAINTLEMMAYATKDIEGDLLCPLIDARRMEVFMAVYNKELKKIIEPKAMIVVPGNFDELLASQTVVFSGNGANKIKTIVQHPHAIFADIKASAANMCNLSERNFDEKNFADTAYVEPFYIKEFYSPTL
ncbi:MAG: tRNA (adenosine(37)-N6)-threonylcarbamoyltransferase complex dimerization subunit type 1 TsaB [Chitinophagaceae bacterium]